MGGSTPNKPARRPAEMATADSPKDSEPPTVSGMPSAFYYITLREKCQTLIRPQIAKKASPQQHISKKRARLTVCSLFLFQRQYRTKSCGFSTHSPPHHAAGNVSVISVPCSGSLLTEIVAWWRAAPCLTIDSPSPVPPTALEWLLSTR